jgi:hypothetical protein
MTEHDIRQQRGDERGREVPDMNEDGPDVSPYGTLVKHDQSETKHDKSQSGNTVPSTLAQVYHNPVVIVAGAYLMTLTT